MSQNDLVIANQSFPSFRTDLNSALQAINTSHSGTSRPSGAVAGTIWLDTTGTPTANTLKFFDGTDDISLASINYTANTVDWLDSTVSITGLSTTATGTVLTLSDTANTSSVNLIIANDKEIRFSEATSNGTNYVSLSAPASLASNVTFTLPSADGTAGQFLKTDGAGSLSFDSLSFSTPLAVIGNATAGSEIRLPEDTDNGSNYVAIKAPNTIASNLTLTLPSADGTSGQVLQTNGSGVLSFATPSGGKVLQVVSATKTDTASTQSATFSDVLTASITPTSASNKILIISSTNIGVSDVGLRAMTRLVRDSTAIFIGDTAGSRQRASWQGGAFAVNSTQSINHTFLDSPNTTSAITYKLQFRSEVTDVTYSVYINRNWTDSDASNYGRGATSITLMEIQA
jgi:hypothetical protein